MILVDKLLRSGIGFVLNTLIQAAESEQDDSERLREELLNAQMQLELGEIDEERFLAIESDVSMRLRQVRERERERDQSLDDPETRIAGVEVTMHVEVDRD